MKSNREHSISYYRHALVNGLQSILLIGIMCLLLAACAYVLFGRDGFVMAIITTAVTLLFMPRISPRWVMQMYRAAPLNEYNFPLGCALVDTLAARAGLEQTPTLYYVPSHTTNAFTVGNRDDAAIAVTDGLLQMLDRRELAGVLAHEIGHIEHNDLWIMNLADILSRFTGIISNLGVLLLLLNLPLILVMGVGLSWSLIGVLVLAPVVMSILQMALSRVREYDADLAAAYLTEDPAGLASALHKIEYNQGQMWQELFLPGRKIPDPSVLRTHPPTDERIRRLIALYDSMPEPFEHHHEHSSDFEGDKPKPPKWHWPGIWY